MSRAARWGSSTGRWSARWDEATERGIGRGMLGDHSHTQLRVGELRSRQLVVEAAVTPRRGGHRRGAKPDAAERATAAKTMASESAVWAVEIASRLAASRSYTERLRARPACAATRRRPRSAKARTTRC